MSRAAVSSTTRTPALTIPSRSSMRRSPLDSGRTVLYPVEQSDSVDIWEAVESSRWHLERWLPWVPFTNTPEACIRFTDACERDWDAGRAVRFTIRDKATRELLGTVGLDNCVHLHRSCELGYWLRRQATGQGLMTEAAKTVVDFALHRLGVHRIRCAAATENHASLRVIQRLGFHFEGVARHAEFVSSRWLDHAVFAILSADDR